MEDNNKQLNNSIIYKASKYVGLGKGQKFNPKKAKVVDDDSLLSNGS